MHDVAWFFLWTFAGTGALYLAFDLWSIWVTWRDRDQRDLLRYKVKAAYRHTPTGTLELVKDDHPDFDEIVAQLTGNSVDSAAAPEGIACRFCGELWYGRAECNCDASNTQVN